MGHDVSRPAVEGDDGLDQHAHRVLGGYKATLSSEKLI
jgi:hypothetical protein